MVYDILALHQQTRQRLTKEKPTVYGNVPRLTSLHISQAKSALAFPSLVGFPQPRVVLFTFLYQTALIPLQNGSCTCLRW